MSRWHHTIAGMTHLEKTPENNAYVKQRLQSRRQDWSSIAYTDLLKSNVTTPREMVSESASAVMRNMLENCTSRNKIPRQLKRTIVVAHKIGSNRRIKVDTGVVYLPTSPLAVTGMTLTSSDDDQGKEAVAEISRLAVDALSPECLAWEARKAL